MNTTRATTIGHLELLLVKAKAASKLAKDLKPEADIAEQLSGVREHLDAAAAICGEQATLDGAVAVGQGSFPEHLDAAAAAVLEGAAVRRL